MLLGRCQSHANAYNVANRIRFSFTDTFVSINYSAVDAFVSDAFVASERVGGVEVVDTYSYSDCGRKLGYFIFFGVLFHNKLHKKVTFQHRSFKN